VGINAARSWLTGHFPEWWPIILGGLFVTVVLLLPNGIIGLPRQCLNGLRRLRRRSAERNRSASRPQVRAERQDLNPTTTRSPL
ncbi:MAG: hypothetical protein OEU26_19620, partial [Candidatus Tectomicrobia bacterium]|nr:hypothetical protein [Candidatus Tectomicrobia bacterium]